MWIEASRLVFEERLVIDDGSTCQKTSFKDDPFFWNDDEKEKNNVHWENDIDATQSNNNQTTTKFCSVYGFKNCQLNRESGFWSTQPNKTTSFVGLCPSSHRSIHSVLTTVINPSPSTATWDQAPISRILSSWKRTVDHFWDVCWASNDYLIAGSEIRRKGTIQPYPLSLSLRSIDSAEIHWRLYRLWWSPIVVG